MTDPQFPPHFCPTPEEADGALDRLIKMAHGDSAGSALAADLLLSWWHGPDWGHFPITHVKRFDRHLGKDVVTLIAYLVENNTCYAVLWDRRADMERLIEDWRGLPS